MKQTVGKIVLVLLLGMLALLILLYLPLDSESGAVADPAASYDEAVARFDAIVAQEAELPIRPGCETQLLAHDGTTERVFVLFHGYRSCPKQFLALGEMLHEMGYTVLLPRMPLMGYAQIPNEDQAALTTDELVDFADQALDIAQGLGNHVTVSGLSAGGLLTAWAAQFRDDVDRAVMISPFLEPAFLPDSLARPAANLFDLVPNIYIWQDAELKMDVPNPAHVYPRNATRPLSQFMLLGFATRADARMHAPRPDAIVSVTNGADGAVDLDPLDELIASWRARGYDAITEFQFEDGLALDHDLIDPEHPNEQIELTYPVLLELLVGAAAE